MAKGRQRKVCFSLVLFLSFFLPVYHMSDTWPNRLLTNSFFGRRTKTNEKTKETPPRFTVFRYENHLYYSQTIVHLVPLCVSHLFLLFQLQCRRRCISASVICVICVCLSHEKNKTKPKTSNSNQIKRQWRRWWSPNVFPYTCAAAWMDGAQARVLNRISWYWHKFPMHTNWKFNFYFFLSFFFHFIFFFIFLFLFSLLLNLSFVHLVLFFTSSSSSPSL